MYLEINLVHSTQTLQLYVTTSTSLTPHVKQIGAGLQLSTSDASL